MRKRQRRRASELSTDNVSEVLCLSAWRVLSLQIFFIVCSDFCVRFVCFSCSLSLWIFIWKAHRTEVVQVCERCICLSVRRTHGAPKTR